jgi:UDP-galactopyranose mutase
MVQACGNKIKILLKTDFREILPHVTFRHMVYTGPIDEYFNYTFGHLPYRSLLFEHEHFTAAQLKDREYISCKKGFWQPAMQVNYPNEEEFTRIVEIKHATGQTCENSTIVREYPDDFGPGKEAYYPIPSLDSASIYQEYKHQTEKTPFPSHLHVNKSMPIPTVSFIGRLATYRYYNMDQVVGMALAECKSINE